MNVVATDKLFSLTEFLTGSLWVLLFHPVGPLQNDYLYSAFILLPCSLNQH